METPLATKVKAIAPYLLQTLQIKPGMQYRRGVTEEGVLKNQFEQLNNAETYNIEQGGPLTVLVTKEGQFVIVDGHHRFFLASRCEKWEGNGNWTSQRMLPAYTLLEEDGWTFEKAKSYGRALNTAKDDTKYWFCDSCDSKFTGDSDICPNCDSKASEMTKDEWVSTLSNYTDDYIPKDKYDQIPNEDFAGPERSFPIQSQEDVDRVARLYGHASDPAAVRRAATAIIKRKGLQMPDVWSQETKEGDAFESDAIEVCECCYEVVSDSATGDVIVTQLAGRADQKNKNNRIYPRKVLQDAINRVRPLARAGALMSEYEHPEVVDVCDRGKCGDKFVEDPTRRTAQILDFTDVDEKGEFRVKRKILKTPYGKKVQDAYQRRKPIGLSVRWNLRSVYDSTQKAYVATYLEILGVDDVEEPAVSDAGSRVDSKQVPGQMQSPSKPEGPDGLPNPFIGESSNTVNPHVPADEQDPDKSDNMRSSADTKQMSNTNTLSSVRTLKSLVARGANINDIRKADQAACDAITDAWLKGEDVADAVATYRATHKLVADGKTIPGFHGGKSGPYEQLANELGGDPTVWGEDVVTGKGEDRMIGQKTSTKVPSDEMKPMIKASDSDMEEEGKKKAEEVKKLENKEKLTDEEDSEEKKEEAFNKVVEDEGHSFHKLSDEEKESVKEMAVKHGSADEEEQEEFVEDCIRTISKARVDSKSRKTMMGQTTNDPAAVGRAEVKSEARPGWDKALKMVAAADDYVRTTLNKKANDYINPDDPETKARRKRNLATMDHVIEQCYDHFARNNPEAARAAADSALSDEKMFEHLARDIKASGDSFAGTTSVLFNQPTVMSYMLIQAFQDMRALDFALAMGPGQSPSVSSPGWEMQAGIGRVFKVPMETYQNPSGFGFQYEDVDFSLLTPGDQGITEGTVNLYWDTFFPAWRYIANSTSIQAIRSLGNGPLNYSVMARQLFHMAARKSRAVDTAICNEVVDACRSYNSVPVTGEAYTTGNSRLPNNSVFPGSGAVTVNLNPTKLAKDAVAATDKFVTYGTGNVSNGGIAVIGAIRLLCGTPGSIGGTTIYYSNNVIGGTPVVRPKATRTLTSPGADSDSVAYPITVSLPANQVLGVLSADGNIYSVPGTTATCAVDYNNGVLVFGTGSGIAGSGGVMTTSTTISYSYATNWDYFIVTPELVTLTTGQTLQEYYNGLLNKIDQVAAFMGSDSRYVAPDLALMSLKVSTYFTQATIFYQLNNPKGTDLYSDEKHFAIRNGVGLMRLNAPWYVGNNSIILSRQRTTLYAIDTPFETYGPFAKYDSSQNLMGGQSFWAAESSAICTPQVKDINGLILNPVSREIVLY